MNNLRVKTLIKKNKPSLALGFQVHQPWRLRESPVGEASTMNAYFDADVNKKYIQKIAHASYIPANKIIAGLLKEYPSLKITLSISGTVLDQLAEYCPEGLESFKQLAQSKAVEFTAMPDYHSLVCLSDLDEFEIQTKSYVKKLKKYLGVKPVVFRNANLLYNDAIGERIHALGFDCVIVEGTDSLFHDQSGNRLYHHPQIESLKIIPRNFRHSDRIAFRYMDEDNLTPEQFLLDIKDSCSALDVITLDIGYETFGEHYKNEEGIFSFLEGLLRAVGSSEDFVSKKFSEVCKNASSAPLEVATITSSADVEKDVSAWQGNDLQREALRGLMALAPEIKSSRDDDLSEIWRRLMSSDHFYYMSTKNVNAHDLPSHYSHYDSPYEAHESFMKALHHLHAGMETHTATARSLAEAELSVTAMQRNVDAVIVHSSIQTGYEGSHL